MPNADVDVTVKLTTDKKGFDVFDITARHIAPNRDYTVFLLEQAGSPFGAAEYIGDLSTMTTATAAPIQPDRAGPCRRRSRMASVSGWT